MSPVSKCVLITTLVTLLITFQITQIECGKRRPLDRILGLLEQFWQLGWKGFRNFPMNFPHLTGLHVNHHRWSEYGPVPAGLPIEGILERKDHPFHEWAKRMYPNGVVKTHLNEYNRGRVSPFNAAYHAFVQDRGLYNYQSVMASPSIDSMSMVHPPAEFASASNDALMSPPFLVNPFSTPEQASQEIHSMDVMNLQQFPHPLVTSSSALSSAITHTPWNEGGLIVRHPFPALPVFAPEQVNSATASGSSSFNPSINSWLRAVKGTSSLTDVDVAGGRGESVSTGTLNSKNFPSKGATTTANGANDEREEARTSKKGASKVPPEDAQETEAQE